MSAFVRAIWLVTLGPFVFLFGPLRRRFFHAPETAKGQP